MLAEALSVLELTPWAGRPIIPAKPEGPIRNLAFGAGIVTYPVLESDLRVDVLIITWAG